MNIKLGELKNRKRVSISLDKQTVERLSSLSEKTGVPKSKLVDWAIFDINEKFNSTNHLKPENYFDTTETFD